MKIIDNDGELCVHLAQIAGDCLLAILQDKSLNNAELGKKGDISANGIIIEELKRHRPNDAILTEESIDDKSRLKANRVWIIDPLDGTLEYSERRDDWAVHIGLAIDGRAKIGAIAIPSQGKIYSSAKIESPLEARATRKPIITASRSRMPQELNELAKFMGAQIECSGSAGFKTAQIIGGHADIYFHTGGQSEWDNCAPIAVAKAHGLYAGDIFGNEIDYNKIDVSVPNLLVCRKEFLAPVSDWVSAKEK